MPHDLPGDHVDPVADRKRALEQYEREKHLMPSGSAVASIMDAGPTIAEAFHDRLRRDYAALIAEARAVPADWADVRADDAGRLARLVRRLVDALVGEG